MQSRHKRGWLFSEIALMGAQMLRKGIRIPVFEKDMVQQIKLVWV
jgi:hypothetical protein